MGNTFRWIVKSAAYVMFRNDQAAKPFPWHPILFISYILRWHPIPYNALLLARAHELWPKVEHYVGNEVPFWTQPHVLSRSATDTLSLSKSVLKNSLPIQGVNHPMTQCQNQPFGIEVGGLVGAEPCKACWEQYQGKGYREVVTKKTTHPIGSP